MVLEAASLCARGDRQRELALVKCRPMGIA